MGVKSYRSYLVFRTWFSLVFNRFPSFLSLGLEGEINFRKAATSPTNNSHDDLTKYWNPSSIQDYL